MDEWDDQAGFDPEDPEIEAWDLMGLDDPVVAWDDTDDLDAYGDVEEPVAEGITYGEGHRAMTWSAWDVGVVFGLGGWLLDHHAAQVGQQIRDALAEAGTDTSTTPTPRGAPYPPPPSGNLYRADASQQNIGAHLDQGRLYGELVTTNTHDRDLLIEAEGQTPTGGKVVVAISFVALSADRGCGSSSRCIRTGSQLHGSRPSSSAMRKRGCCTSRPTLPSKPSTPSRGRATARESRCPPSR